MRLTARNLIVAVILLVLVLFVVATIVATLATSGDEASPQPTAPGAASAQSKEIETPAQVIAALKSAGLPIGAVRSYTASSDPNTLLGRPGQYTGKANFRDRRLEPSDDFDTTSGGSVETFDSQGDAQQRYDYVDAITQGSPLFAEYHYLEGDAFLRLSNELTPAQAKVYEEAFRRAL